MWAGWVMIVRTFSSLPTWVIVETPSSSSAQSSQKRSIGRFPASAAASATVVPTNRRFCSFCTARDRDQRPVDGPAVQAVRAGLLELDADALAERRVPQPCDGGVGAAVVHPARAYVWSSCHAGQIRVGVHRHVEPLGAGGVDHRQQLRRPALVHGEAEVGVRVVQRHAGAPHDLDAVAVRLERVLP